MLDLIGGIVELNLIAHPKAVVPTSKANRDAADAFCMKFAGLIPVDFVDIRPYQHTSKYRSGRGKSRVQWGAQEHITANFGKLVGDVYHVWPAHIFTDGPTILAMRYGNGYIRTKAEWVKELKLLREVVINGNLLQRRRGGRNRENPCLDRADSSTFFIILS